MKCAWCGREITGQYMVSRVNGKFVPVHRDCKEGTTVRGHGHGNGKQRKSAPKNKALQKFRREHDEI